MGCAVARVSLSASTADLVDSPDPECPSHYWYFPEVLVAEIAEVVW
jgi:hypothetical protein